MKVIKNIKVKVDDLITPNAKAIFVLESPHTDEVKAEIPLAGESGLVFSRVLFDPDPKKAAGVLIKHNPEKYPYTVINTFQYPLKIRELEHKYSKLGEEIQKLDSEFNQEQKFDSKQYKRCLKDLFSFYAPQEHTDQYLKRIFKALYKANGKKIVFCGNIAQAYFEYALDIEEQQFNKSFNLELGYTNRLLYVLEPTPQSKQCKINSSAFYVWHPSPKNGTSPWDTETKIVDLKNFIMPSANNTRPPQPTTTRTKLHRSG